MNCPLCHSNGAESSYENDPSYLVCGHCFLIFLRPERRLRREAEKQFYALHENHGTPYLNYLLKLARPVVARVAKGAKGLDFGCGPTEGMRELLSPLGFSVDSYDPFFFPRVLPKNHCNFALCSEAAEHFFQPDMEFAALHASLKKGAILGVSSQLWEGQGAFRDWYYRRDPTHVSIYRPETVRWIAKRFGWELLELSSPLWVLRKA